MDRKFPLIRRNAIKKPNIQIITDNTNIRIKLTIRIILKKNKQTENVIFFL